MPSHLTNVVFLLLFVSRQQLQAEIKALCAAPLAGAPTPEHGKKDVQQGRDSVAAYLGGAQMRCPLPILSWLLMTLPLGLLGSSQIIHSCPWMKGRAAAAALGEAQAPQRDINPKPFPSSTAARQVGWLWLNELGKTAGRRRCQSREQHQGPEPLLSSSFDVAKSMADINHCHPTDLGGQPP